ncbi:carbon storage regulator CsrA [Thermopirellula anaerolimosa]
MLVLSRKTNEQIIIGDDIVVTVVSIRGGSVRLGIDAPATLSIHRGEIYALVKKASLPSAPTEDTPGPLRNAPR